MTRLDHCGGRRSEPGVTAGGRRRRDKRAAGLGSEKKRAGYKGDSWGRSSGGEEEGVGPTLGRGLRQRTNRLLHTTEHIHRKSSVVDTNTLNLDPDPEFWPNLDPDPELCYKFIRRKFL